MLASLGAAGCAAPAPGEPGFQPASGPAATASEPDQDAPTSSLGDPFVLVFDVIEPDGASAEAQAQSAWAMLSSDACDVDLSAFNLAFGRSEGSAAVWVSTVAPTRGVVLDASSHHAVVHFEPTVEIGRGAGWAGGEPISAILEVEMRQDQDRVSMHAQLRLDTPGSEMPLSLDVSVQGGFNQDPAAVPERRFACPHR